MFNYLLVILEKGAVPFCHYSNPYYHSLAQPSFMPLEILEEVVVYAGTNGQFLNYLYGKHPLPKEYDDLIGTTSHVKMIPLCQKGKYTDGVLVLEADENHLFGVIESDSGRNLILRAGAADLPDLSDTVDALRGKFKRLNIHLVGMESFTEKDLITYENQLIKIGNTLQRCYQAGDEIEINVLSDRLLLQQMNNCDAGLKHLTIAPNGKVYICPGFYHDDETSAVGILAEGQELTGCMPRLFELSCAPICSRCDAYHCKRCVYMNKVKTLEFNVPSREQCQIAHAEREVSRRLLKSLRATRLFDALQTIPGLPYNDPFDMVVQEVWDPETPAVTGPTTMDSNDYLELIYEMQKKILRKL
jgi:CXXX repeat peptide maturase